MSHTHRLLPVLADAPAFVQRTPAAQPQSRRSALRTLFAGGLGLALWPWRTAWAKKVGLKLAQVPALGHVGGSAGVTIKGQELLLVRDSAQTVRAIDPMCTHKKCKVFFRRENNDLGCKCHKSRFSLGGKVLGGPAPRALKTFPARLNGEQIVVDLGD